jgi:group I intron endonuclease
MFNFRTCLSEESTRVIADFLLEYGLNPVAIYDNLSSDDTKVLINKELRGKSGVYLILNKLSLDFYVGSASTNKFYSRFSNHLLYLTGSKILKSAVLKNSIGAFVFIVLEYFSKVVDQNTNKELIDLEDFYLKTLQPDYNILTEAGFSFGYKHTEITRLRLSVNYSQARKEFIGNLNRGRSLSLVTCERLRKVSLLRKIPSYSEQALLNMKGSSKPVSVFNLSTGTVFGIFPSLLAAAEATGSSKKTLYRTLKTEKKILKRKWRVS